MPRRTVTVPTGFDKAIRSYQAKLMRLNNRDVTYTEAINYVLFWGFLGGPRAEGEIIAFWKEGGEDRVVPGTELFTALGDPEARRNTIGASDEEWVLSENGFGDLMEGFSSERIRFEGTLDMLPTGPEPNE